MKQNKLKWALGLILTSGLVTGSGACTKRATQSAASAKAPLEIELAGPENSQSDLAPEANALPADEDAGIPLVAGEILIRVKDPKSDLKNFKEKYEINDIDREAGIFLLRSPALYGKETEVAKQLKDSGSVLTAEPNHKAKIEAAGEDLDDATSDPQFLRLWGLKNYGQDAPNGVEGVAGADIKATEAWKVTRGSRDVVVAVIDTGIDYTHEDLKENAWINELEERGIPGVDDDGNGYVDDIHGWDFISGRQELTNGQIGDADPMDDHGHGTHCAGTIGAAADNTKGVAGVSPKVKLLPIKFLDSGGSGATDTQLRALKYVLNLYYDKAKTRPVVDVISASYGGPNKSELIEYYVTKLHEKGVLFVAAAGNNGTNSDVQPSYPAGYRAGSLISVAATDNRDQIASFSNYGLKAVDLAAPGVGITSTYPTALAAQDEGDKQPYRTFSGTSMATPHVAGAAALMIAADPSLKRNPAEIKRRMLAGVDALPQLAGRVASGGRLNLLKAVGNRGGGNIVAEAGWVQENYALSTPSKPTAKMDVIWKITRPGARAIRVHIAEAIIDWPYDAATLFDGSFRPVMSLPAMTFDLWTPPVLGDTVYLKFSNSLVAIEGADGKLGATYANHDSDGVTIDQISFLPREVH